MNKLQILRDEYLKHIFDTLKAYKLSKEDEEEINILVGTVIQEAYALGEEK